MVGHVVHQRLYILVFAALIGLTALTTGVAFVDLGKWNTLAALAIAVCKASLVILFFMHLRWSSGLMRMVLLAAFVWFAILVALTLSDEFTRQWTPVPSNWQSQVQQQARQTGARTHSGRSPQYLTSRSLSSPKSAVAMGSS